MMKRRLLVRPAAERDLTEARDWYESQRSGLGSEFLDAVELRFDHIREFPESCAAGYRKVRPAVMRRFPYVIYYRILETDVEVLAVLHGRRDPRVWQRRS
jgi:plasmid stabilization system protein ParE